MKKLILLFLAGISTCLFGQNMPPDRWEYIEVDSSRQKWGDFDEPEWLRYFGLDFCDVNHDGMLDIVSGRYIYLNPGGKMLGPWQRIDLGFNIDAMIAVDVDGDANADVIAQALPDVYWLEAENEKAVSWKARVIAQLPKTGHVNGQGYRLADVFRGGKPEILMSAEGGVFAIPIPGNTDYSEWKTYHLVKSKSNEGFDCADMDGDGDLDIVAGNSSGEDGEHADLLSWYENPGNDYQEWKAHKIGNTVNAIDRVSVADLNGDGLYDVGIAEEQWPPKGPTAYLFWFEQKKDGSWERHTVVEQWSLHNLDAADMDQDGDVDLVTCEHKGEDLKLQIWENDGTGKFAERLIDKGKESHLGTQLSDLDQDGDLDIVSIAWDNYKYVHLWRNDAITFEPGSVQIKECLYKGSDHYKITSQTATWFLDKSSGGFSSVIDREGKDWVNWKRDVRSNYPESAAGEYRGIPNMLFGAVPDAGAGHPGFDKTQSAKVVNKNTIRFVSTSGSFVWNWSFYDNYAKLTIEKVGLDQNYWVLYEGPVAGRYHPKTWYWGTDKGIRTEIPDYLKGDVIEEYWQWVYFGDKNAGRVFFAAQEKEDELPEILGFLGATNKGLDALDGMVVFGFGRNRETKPLMTKPNVFYFGFYEGQVKDGVAFKKLSKHIKNITD